MPIFTFKDFWLAEIIHQREANWGPMHDTAIMARLQAEGGYVHDKIIRRALLLSRREGLYSLVQQWLFAAKIALFFLVGAAVIAGIGAAYSTLHVGQSHVNIMMALVTLLGLHALSFFVWVLTFINPWQEQTVLGKMWLWISRKIARGPDNALAAQAFIHVSKQHRCLRWVLSAISHGFWMVLLCVATIALLLMLATLQVSFGWETTILSANGFMNMIHTIGFVPSVLGFPMPDDSIIQSSGNHISMQENAQKIWSVWLIGQVVVWGILLRTISFFICCIKARQALKKIDISMADPSYLPLVRRLEVGYEKLNVDQQATPYRLPHIHHTITPWVTQRVVLGLELPPDFRWPIFSFDSSVSDIGKIESREQRQQLLAQLIEHPIKEMLIVCDGHQTPDRGLAYTIKDLSYYVEKIVVLISGAPSKERLALWEKSLLTIGIGKDAIFDTPSQLYGWGRA